MVGDWEREGAQHFLLLLLTLLLGIQLLYSPFRLLFFWDCKYCPALPTASFAGRFRNISNRLLFCFLLFHKCILFHILFHILSHKTSTALLKWMGGLHTGDVLQRKQLWTITAPCRIGVLAKGRPSSFFAKPQNKPISFIISALLCMLEGGSLTNSLLQCVGALKHLSIVIAVLQEPEGLSVCSLRSSLWKVLVKSSLSSSDALRCLEKLILNQPLPSHLQGTCAAGQCNGFSLLSKVTNARE